MTTRTFGTEGEANTTTTTATSAATAPTPPPPLIKLFDFDRVFRLDENRNRNTRAQVINSTSSITTYVAGCTSDFVMYRVFFSGVQQERASPQGHPADVVFKAEVARD